MYVTMSADTGQPGEASRSPLERAATGQWRVPSRNFANGVSTRDVALRFIALEVNRGYTHALEAAHCRCSLLLGGGEAASWAHPGNRGGPR